MKAFLLCVTSQSVLTFRRNLIQALIEKGVDVHVCAFDEDYKSQIEELGATFHCIEDKNRSLNPFKVLSLKNKYCKVIKEVKPDVVFTFMVKPNTFGVLAAKKAGVKKIFSMVEGAGDVFINDGLKWKIIRKGVCHLYKKAFRNSQKVFFLNKDDKAEFLRRKLVRETQCEIVHGIGVDLEKFADKPLKNHRTFLMVARMLKTKGVFEYCECARIVKRKYPDAVFNYLGAEGTVKLDDIREYIDDGSIVYLGTTDDVRPYYEDCAAYVLPSYREGMPMSVMEAEAVGRAIIATDVNGCRDTVVNGYNGFLVPRGDANALSEKIVYCIEHPEETELFGANSRKYAEENFDQKKINEVLTEIIL